MFVQNPTSLTHIISTSSEGDVFKIRVNCCVLLSVVMGAVAETGPDSNESIIPMSAVPEPLKRPGSKGRSHARAPSPSYVPNATVWLWLRFASPEAREASTATKQPQKKS